MAKNKKYESQVSVVLRTQLSKGFDRVNTLELLDPKLLAEEIELDVTNGLGYKKVRKTLQENKTNTQEGLIRHLANMGFVEFSKYATYERKITSEIFRALVDLEKSYAKQTELYIETAKTLIDARNGLMEFKKIYEPESFKASFPESRLKRIEEDEKAFAREFG